MKVVVAIENPLVRLDVEDSLRDMGMSPTRCVSTAMQALATLENDRCDAVVLGLEGSNPHCQRLVDALEQLRIPVVFVASGVNLLETLPRLAHAESLSVPFDSSSLAAALGRALQSALKPPGGN